MSLETPIIFTGHHIDVTEPLRDFTTKKFERLLRHFGRIISINVTFEVVKLSQIAKATINAAGKSFHADSESNNMYESVDLLVDKLDRQIKEHKQREHEH
ncbi:MAG: ribosome-associated translation inhibitor RaiA [Legionellales bacterium]|nr:ribosome-associated translation inhibitor RaiA [Legionellales bacterium]